MDKISTQRSAGTRFAASAAAAVLLLPYVAIYLLNLWSLSHYQFFPVLIAAVAWIGHERWDRTLRHTPPAAIVGLLCAAFLLAAAAVLFASPWVGYLAFVFALAATLIQMGDRSGGSLALLLVPMLLIWQPPYSPNVGGDVVLIGRLQQLSAAVASQWLDMAGFVHTAPGTILELPSKSFGVAEACSGVQSFFALLCFASLLIVYQRRPAVHTAILLATSVFWAVLMNTVRITAIPVAHELFGFDLSEGLAHDTLGYATMGAAMTLLFSTDQLLKAIGLDTVEPRRFVKGNLGVGRSAVAAAWSGARWRPADLLRSPAACGIVLTFLAAGGLQAYDVAASWGQRRGQIDFFRGNVFLSMAEEDAPTRIGRQWVRVEHRFENRERGADLGERSNVWSYAGPFGVASASFDQAFPGWHELTTCYERAGMRLVSRDVRPPSEEDPWPLVVAELASDAGGRSLLVFSLFDQAGRPLEAPGQWDYWTSLRQRVLNRLSPSVRGSLFAAAAYQVQLLIPNQERIDEATVVESIAAFRQFRTAVRRAALDR